MKKIILLFVTLFSLSFSMNERELMYVRPNVRRIRCIHDVYEERGIYRNWYDCRYRSYRWRYDDYYYDRYRYEKALNEQFMIELIEADYEIEKLNEEPDYIKIKEDLEKVRNDLKKLKAF